MFSKRQSTPSMQGINSLNISQSQKSDMPKNLKTELITIPSTSQFSWGSYGVLDFKEKNVKVHELILNFNLSAVSGLSGTPVTSYPNLNPSFYFFSRIELVMGNIVLDTLYPDAQFILNQLIVVEESDRLCNNLSAGNYSSIAQRNTLSTTAGSNWYLPLKSLFDQSHINILTQNHEIQVRVYMNTLANVINQSSLAGTAICNINAVNLIARVTRLDSEMVNSTLQQISRAPRHYLFYETRYATFTVQSGVSATTLVLTPIVGKVSVLYFIVRPVASLTGNNAFNYTPITSFAILGAGGDNIVGGTTLPSSLNLLQMGGRMWSKSNFLTDSFTGVNNSNVYTYSFSQDPVESLLSGRTFSSRNFVGAEQLQLNFTGSLAANVQVDVFCYLESIVEQTATTIKKIVIKL